MHFVEDSFTIVLLGDWSKFYIQPDWVANNVFESAEIEIGIQGFGLEVSILYKKGNIVFKPDQEKIVFSVTNIQNQTVELLSKYVNNFLQKACTPSFSAYGLNVDYSDNNDTLLASVFDSMSDSPAILGLGYQVDTKEIKRSLLKDDDNVIINMQYHLDQAKATIHFNEHHPCPSGPPTTIDVPSIQKFLEETHRIISGLGYIAEVDN